MRAMPGLASTLPKAAFAPTPRPANVPYNDWPRVALPPLEEFRPALPVSVIMPCHQTPEAVLARTLAALERQIYPRDLFEVLIVDDGSDPPLKTPRSPLNLRIVRQERRGCGIARSRNAGMRAAAHSIVLFLDGDSLAEAGWMAAHARWHHVLSDVLTVGFRAHVSVQGIDAQAIRHRPGGLWELFAGRPADWPGHENEHYMLRTRDLTARADDLFRAVVGGNFGIGREFYWSVGGSDESFARWGGDDEELAWRAWTQGGLLAPVRAAFAWHQGRWAEGTETKQRSAKMQRGKLTHLIAHPLFRSARPGRIYAVPQFVATIEAGCCSAEQVIAVVANVLADRARDLVVRIELDGSAEQRLARLRDLFGADPRVHIAPALPALDEFPAAPFHVRLSARVTAKNLVHRLCAALGDAVMATALLPDGTRLSITRSWALHRARRTGGSPADFGDVRKLRLLELRLRFAAGTTDRAAALDAMGIRTRWQYLLHRGRDLRSLQEAWRFVRWLALWCRQRLSPDNWTAAQFPAEIYAPAAHLEDPVAQAAARANGGASGTAKTDD